MANVDRRDGMVKEEERSRRDAREDPHKGQPIFRLPPSSALAPRPAADEVTDNTTEGGHSRTRCQCPVFVMMPLDTVHVIRAEHGLLSDVQSPEALALALAKLKHANVKHETVLSVSNDGDSSSCRRIQKHLFAVDAKVLHEPGIEPKSSVFICRFLANTVQPRHSHHYRPSGVMVDVWWGIVERAHPLVYDFVGYRKLFDCVRAAGLDIQAVMSFHSAGSNVGDTCQIDLPPWVLEVGEDNPDIFYTDASGLLSKDCLSTGCLDEPVLLGRSPLQAYADFVAAFASEFNDLIGDFITEITVGCGPAGELRYPSYPEGDGRWRFPGVGEFQCYDKYMRRSLREAAEQIGQPLWGKSGPDNSGHYNSRFWETEFFQDGGSWCTEYGHFFLSWYSSLLVQHADSVLTCIRKQLKETSSGVVLTSVEQDAVDGSAETLFRFEERSTAVKLGIKLAGVHWCVKSFGHAAELTAGYYNTAHRNGYRDVMAVLAKHGAQASFTCVEMRDCEHPPEGACGPEALLNQVIETAAEYGVPLTGENALQRYDRYAFERMYDGAMGTSAAKGSLAQLTFLRMGNLFFDNWDAFNTFMAKMQPVEE